MKTYSIFATLTIMALVVLCTYLIMSKEPQEVITRTVTVVDTLVVERVIVKTVTKPGKIDTMWVNVDGDSVAVKVAKATHVISDSLVSGSIGVKYEFPPVNRFTFKDSLIVKEKTVVSTITKYVALTPPVLRMVASGGYLAHVEGGATVQVGVGISFSDKIDIFALGASNKSYGASISWRF